MQYVKNSRNILIKQKYYKIDQKKKKNQEDCIYFVIFLLMKNLKYENFFLMLWCQKWSQTYFYNGKKLRCNHCDGFKNFVQHKKLFISFTILVSYLIL